MSKKKSELYVFVTLSLFFCVSGFAQDLRTGSLTNAITATDDEKTKEALTKLEEIWQLIVDAKPRADLWRTGQQAFPHLQLLADRWDDPRSEAILKQLTNSGPNKIEGELCMQTLAYAAERYLYQLQANREYASIMKNTDTKADQIQKIREYFNQNPAVVAQDELRKRKGFLVDKLLKTVEEVAGADGIDLMLQHGRFSRAHLSKYDDAIFLYANKIGSRKARQIYSVVDYVNHIAATRNAKALPFIADWLNEETNDRDAESLAMCIANLPGGETNLLTALNHKCPSAVKYAAGVLAVKYPNETVTALTALIARRKADGANPAELSDIQSQISKIQKTRQGEGIHP